MSIAKKLLFALICVILGEQAVAQVSRSPFSRQGIGDIYGSSLINTTGMGGVGVSQPQYWFVNNQNPALLPYNTLTVFQLGIAGETKTIRQDSLSEKAAGGNLIYLVTAFPIKPTRWTTAVGIAPYSRVNYQINYYDFVQNTSDSLFITEEGKGGLTELYWSNGVRIGKDFSVGVKGSYIFSSIENFYSNQLISNDQASFYKATIKEKLYVRDINLTTGIAYSVDSLFRNKRYRLNIGATYAFEADLSSSLRREQYRETGSSIGNTDTLSTTDGSTIIPAQITAGVSLGYLGKWTIGSEFAYQDWSTFRTLNQGSESLGESWRVALGGEFMPDNFSDNYFKRITYRIGVNYEQTPYRVNVAEINDAANYQSVKDIGINFGFSLPAGNSSLDFAFKYGRRGNRTETVLDETYFRMYFGITFNDRWFIKRRFD